MGEERQKNYSSLRGVWITLTVGLVVTALWSGVGVASPETSDSKPDVTQIAFSQLDQVRYNGLDIGIVEARIAPPNAPGQQYVAIVELAIYNNTTKKIRMHKEAFNLEAFSDQELENSFKKFELDRFEFSERLNRVDIGSGEMVQPAAVFKLGNTKRNALERLNLLIGEPGRQPSLLNLAGIALSDPEAVEVEVQNIKESALEVESAKVLLEEQFYRPPTGENLMQIVVKATGPQASLPEPKQWELWASIGEDNPDSATLLRTEKAKDSSNYIVVTLLFRYPEAATKFDLNIVANQQTTGVGGLEILNVEQSTK